MTRRPNPSDALYRERVGEPRNLPDDHPDRWQWEYQGKPAERADLLERLREASTAHLRADERDQITDGQLELPGL